MTDVLERAAKAAWWQFRLKRLDLRPDDTVEIAALEETMGGALDTWPETNMSADADDFRAAVRAVLLAIREPDAGMIADRVVRQHGYSGDIDMVWTAMIDEILKDGP